MALNKQEFEDKFSSLLSKFMLDTIKELQKLKDPNDLVLKLKASSLNVSKTITEYIETQIEITEDRTEKTLEEKSLEEKKDKIGSDGSGSNNTQNKKNKIKGGN